MSFWAGMTFQSESTREKSMYCVGGDAVAEIDDDDVDDDAATDVNLKSTS